MQEITFEDLKKRGEDYYLASWEDNQLVLEPYCACGQVLDEDFFCSHCNRSCSIGVVVCRDFKVVGIVEKFIHGHPQFRNFKAFLLRSS